MHKWVPYTSDEWAIITGASGTGIRLVCFALGEKNILSIGKVNRTFRKGAIVLEYDDKSMHYDPEDVIV